MNQTTLLLFELRRRTVTELGRFKTVHNAVWSRDERFLYFEVVDERSIYRLWISDRALERVVRLEPVWKPARGFSVFEGLAPDDSPLIACHRYDPAICALDWAMR